MYRHSMNNWGGREREGMESGTVVGWVGKGERGAGWMGDLAGEGVWWRSRLRGNLIRGLAGKL